MAFCNKSNVGMKRNPEMLSHDEILNVLRTEDARSRLSRLYGGDESVVSTQTARYERLIAEHRSRFGTESDGIRLLSAPGRVEVGGNHTDHNHGRVLAAAINLDAIAVATPASNGRLTLSSEGYGRPFVIDLADVERKDSEKQTSVALIRGVCRAFQDRGYKVNGFNACVSSDVAVGSGLSSSAAFEVLVATILNYLCNGGAIPPRDIALIGQYAENEYFGKPSGLMDQMTSAVGGLIGIDFENPTNPAVNKVDFDFETSGFDVMVVNTGASHADLNEHYSSVAGEMRAVAMSLGGDVLRQFSVQQWMDALKELREKVGDRAVLRALHFFADNERVVEQVNALEQGQFDRFLSLVNESGRSSWMLCQNVYAAERPAEQGLSVALTVTDRILKGRGACRVHGGGFAGTILAFVPHELTAEYTGKMDELFGERAARSLRIRSSGAGEFFTGP
jgi:galactokinase